MAHTERLGQLRENLTEYFDLDELRSLCFDLGVDWDRLRGEEKAGKVTALLTSLDNAGRIPELIERCARLRPNVAWQELLRAAEAPSPFKGLQYFDEADADLFFGRELLTAKLVSHLAPHPPFLPGEGAQGERFLGVVGASGSGKSSVVRAGLVPALRRGEPLADGTLPPDGSTHWPIYVITPGAHPLEELAEPLTRDVESVTAFDTLVNDLKTTPRALHLAALRLTRRASAQHLLLVVDQFEELFTACKDEALRRAFVDNLLYAVGAPSSVAEAKEEGWREAGGGPTLVVIALRADFYAHCAQYANLREALAQHQEFIGPMTADELRRAIEQPAHLNGWEFEAGLVDLLLRDVGDEPGALPLLSHALLETWKRRHGRTLTLEGYHASGGVRGAIARTADDVYNRLTPDQQQIARNIFMRLTELGEGTQDTRRRVALTELVPREQDKPAIEAVVKVLADARLVTTEKDVAEVAHEALIREWPTLRHWLDEDRVGLRLHRQLTEDAEGWIRLNRDEGALYRGVRLAQATEWSETRTGKMNDLECEFLGTSRALAEREMAERKAQQERELQDARKLAQAEKLRADEHKRAAHRLSIRNRIITAVGTLALIAAIVAIIFWIRTEQQRRRARSGELASLALSHLSDRPDLALLFSAEAFRSLDTYQTRSSLLTTLRAFPRLEQFLSARRGNVRSLAFSPNGKLLASGSSETIILWDVAARRPIGQPLTVRGADVASLAFSPDSKILASGHGNSTVILWDVDTGQPIGSPLTGHPNPISKVAFSPDGKTLASQSSPGGEVILWDVASRRPISHPAPAGLIAFGPDGKLLAFSSKNDTIVVQDVATGQPVGQPLTGHSGSLVSLALSKDGRTLAVGNDRGTIMLWDMVNRRPLGDPLTGHSYLVIGVAFSPDGKTLASSGADGTVRLWNIARRQLIGDPLIGHSDWVWSVAFSSDGKMVASGGDDGAVILWTIAYRELGQALEGHAALVISVAFSPDGKILASGSADSTIRLWNVASGEPLGRPLAGHSAGVAGLAFSRDGKTLASSSAVGATILWDVAAQKPIGRLLTSHSMYVDSLAFSSDGKVMASGSDYNNTIVLLDVASRQPIGQPLAGHSGMVLSVAFSRDGKTLASIGADKKIILWNIATGQPVGQFPYFSDAQHSLALSPDGKILAFARGEFIDFWDAASGKLIGEPLAGHSDDVTSLAFSPDGKTLASGSQDNTIILWDVAERTPIGQPLTGHKGSVYNVIFSPDGKTLASGGADGIIYLWNVASGLLVEPPLIGHSEGVHSLAFSPSGDMLASVGNDSTIRLWNVASHQPVDQFPTSHSGVVQGVTFHSDGRILVAGDEQGTIFSWDIASHRPIGRPPTGHASPVTRVALSPDGKTLASGYGDGTVLLWDVATRELISPSLAGHSDFVSSLAFSPDGKILASGSQDKTIQLWGVINHRPLGQPITGHSSGVLDLAFSPDGKTLASCSADIRLWSVGSRQAIGQPMTGHSGLVRSLAFSPNGKTLASGSTDGTILLWNVASRQPIGKPLTSNGWVWSIAFSLDGKTLASGSTDKTIILWNVDPQSWLARVCQMAGRNFAQYEWDTYFTDEPYRPTCPQWPKGK